MLCTKEVSAYFREDYMIRKYDRDEPKVPEGQEERRKYKRINKNFILTYFDKTNPDEKYEITQLKNISLGGMCFITTRRFEPPAELRVELKTPFLSEATFLEGKILESHEKVKNLIYETRIQFSNLVPHAVIILEQLIEFFTKGEKKRYA